METDHSEKEAWVEEDHRGEHTWASAGGERRAGGEEKSSSGSSEGEEEEEEEGEVGEDIPHVMEGAANYEEFAKDFENPSLSYEIPMDQMNAPVFHDNMQAVRCSNNAGSEAKQMESGSEEGEIADDEPDEQERDTEVCGLVGMCVVSVYNRLVWLVATLIDFVEFPSQGSTYELIHLMFWHLTAVFFSVTPPKKAAVRC